MATVSSQTTPNGYRDTPAFMVSFGGLTVVGVEGNDSYGDGCAHARAAGIDVREVPLRIGRPAV
jgi:hypothetical protein